jgi:hypothetical protein
MKDDDLKALARSRRESSLRDLRDGVSWGDRVFRPKNTYKRSMKYRPQSPEDWDELED